MTAEYVARRFALSPQKGHIAVGAEADLVLVDLQHSTTLQAADLFYRHQHSPYVGRMLRGRVVRTLLRGQTIFLGGLFISTPAGRLVKPFSSQ
jgi:allantoinase